MYRPFAIKRVDATDEFWAEELHALHALCFTDDTCPRLKTEEFEGGYWWLVFDDAKPIAFAGLLPGKLNKGFGYLARAGVHPKYRGQGIQQRMIRVRERYARKLKWKGCVSDTSDTPASANSLINEGYKIYAPKTPWGFRHTIYWRKLF
jgi:GNAT superfamily N-acetyltransferase